jgi:acyl-CoA synthetase (AMP-forming)/AMP-acid ligase II
MYGLTEATARLSYLPPEQAEAKAGSIGRGIPGVELRIVDEAGRERPRGEQGQLVARGRNITAGYLRAPEETAALLKDGWLWTGDLGYQDADGFIFLVGRAKEMLKIGGHRVSPLEIEQALQRHPDVLEAAVVGAPDPVGEQLAAAFVVRRPGAELSDADLKRHCRGLLAAFKVPKVVAFVDALPKSGAGQVLKNELVLRMTGESTS